MKTLRKSEKSWQSEALLVLLALALLMGCTTTLTPVQPAAKVASWDGTNQNSGFVRWTNGGGILTPHACDRYNGLIALYGGRFVPPLKPDAGLTQCQDGLWFIDAQHLADFALLCKISKTTQK